MTQAKLNTILEKHRKWLNDEEGGECANLQRAVLPGANLQGANLQGANLQGAELWHANIDYSCLPIWCGVLKMRICDRIAIQLLYHVLSLIAYSDHVSPYIKKLLLTKEIVELANKFHRVDECGRLEVYEEGAA